MRRNNSDKIKEQKMIDAKKIISQWLTFLDKETEWVEKNGDVIISLPFTIPDSHFVEISVHQLQSNYFRLSDMENTISELFLRGMNINSVVRNTIEEIVAQNKLKIKNDEIFTIVKIDTGGEAIHNMLQALLSISNLIFLKRSKK